MKDEQSNIVSSYDLVQLSTYSGGWYKVPNLEQAEAFCAKIANSHYENFPVASILMPKDKRQDIYNIYAFARTADDIADTLLELSTAERLEILDNYLNNLRIYVEQLDSPKHNKALFNPTLLAVAATIRRLNLPIEPFEKLIKAFSMDADFQQAERFEDLHNYCTFSANPIGELILRVFNRYDDESADYSDSVCTGLQLANFWQDLSVDLPNNRCFVPKQILEKYGLANTPYQQWSDNNDLEKNKDFEKLLSELFEHTQKLFTHGRNLIPMLTPKRLRVEISATIYGGELILKKTKELGKEILISRPKISKFEFLFLGLKALIS